MRRRVVKRQEGEKPLVTLDLNLTFMHTLGSRSDPQAWIGKVPLVPFVIINLMRLAAGV